MGKTDTLTKEYMRDTEVFADAFNYLIYGGEEVILPEKLHELDITSIANLFSEDNSNAQVQVYRDVLKYAAAKEDGKFAYLILGIENQTGIDYAMPVRNMLYDALQYYYQVKNIAKNKGRKDIKLRKEEFLSGITKGDKLLPVITLVVYFGGKAWDGPKSLHEMLTFKDAKALAYTADYKINLLEPASMTEEDINRLKSDLRDVFSFIKCSGDSKKLKKLVEGNEDFKSMKRLTAEVIKSVTNTDVNIPEGEECVDMCLAIQQMKEEAEAIGEARGAEIARLELLSGLVRDGIMTLTEAAKRINLTEDQLKEKIEKAGYAAI